jgi:hypothetical protein
MEMQDKVKQKNAEKSYHVQIADDNCWRAFHVSVRQCVQQVSREVNSFAKITGVQTRQSTEACISNST